MQAFSPLSFLPHVHQAKSAKSPDFALTFLNALVRHQQRLTTITEQLKPPLTLLAGHICNLLAQGNSLSVSEVAASLKIELSRCSRAVAALRSRGIVASNSDSQDRRSLRLGLTKKGHQVLHANNQTLSRAVDLCVAPLDLTDRERLFKLFFKFGDILEAPKLAQGPGMSDFLIALRRLTIPLGLLQQEFLGAKLTSTEFHLLSCVDDSPSESLKISQLSVISGRSMPALNRFLESLQSRKFISRQTGKLDGRERMISLRPEGRAILNSARAAAKRIINEKVIRCNRELVVELVTLISVYANSADYPRSQANDNRPTELSLFSHGLTVTHATSPASLGKARAFYIAQLADANEWEKITAEIFPLSSNVFLFYRGTQIVGVLEESVGSNESREAFKSELSEIVRKELREVAQKVILQRPQIL